MLSVSVYRMRILISVPVLLSLCYCVRVSDAQFMKKAISSKFYPCHLRDCGEGKECRLKETNCLRSPCSLTTTCVAVEVAQVRCFFGKPVLDRQGQETRCRSSRECYRNTNCVVDKYQNRNSTRSGCCWRGSSFNRNTHVSTTGIIRSILKRLILQDFKIDNASVNVSQTDFRASLPNTVHNISGNTNPESEVTKVPVLSNFTITESISNNHTIQSTYRPDSKSNKTSTTNGSVGISTGLISPNTWNAESMSFTTINPKNNYLSNTTLSVLDLSNTTQYLYLIDAYKRESKLPHMPEAMVRLSNVTQTDPNIDTTMDSKRILKLNSSTDSKSFNVTSSQTQTYPNIGVPITSTALYLELGSSTPGYPRKVRHSTGHDHSTHLRNTGSNRPRTSARLSSDNSRLRRRRRNGVNFHRSENYDLNPNPGSQLLPLTLPAPGTYAIGRYGEHEPAVEVPLDKPGQCSRMVLGKWSVRCMDTCFNDADCPYSQKCCHNGCAMSCQMPVSAFKLRSPAQKTGRCPRLAISGDVSRCLGQTCSTDNECPGSKKCCISIGCGLICKSPDSGDSVS